MDICGAFLCDTVFCLTYTIQWFIILCQYCSKHLDSGVYLKEGEEGDVHQLPCQCGPGEASTEARICTPVDRARGDITVKNQIIITIFTIVIDDKYLFCCHSLKYRGN